MPYERPQNRQRQRTKTAQQENLDKQILHLHKAMAEKLMANHQYIPQVLQTIEGRYESGKMRHGAYLFWSSLLEYINQPSLFMDSLLEDSPLMQKYRRQTPLVGILTEQERQTVLDQLIL